VRNTRDSCKSRQTIALPKQAVPRVAKITSETSHLCGLCELVLSAFLPMPFRSDIARASWRLCSTHREKPCGRTDIIETELRHAAHKHNYPASLVAIALAALLSWRRILEFAQGAQTPNRKHSGAKRYVSPAKGKVGAGRRTSICARILARRPLSLLDLRALGLEEFPRLFSELTQPSSRSRQSQQR